MARHPNPVPSAKLGLRISQPLKDKLDLLLFSPLEGRVPVAAYKNYFEALIEKDFRVRAEYEKLKGLTNA